MTSVAVIGVDGMPLSPVATGLLADAGLVVGSARLLARTPLPEGIATRTLDSVAGLGSVLAEHNGPIVLLASGDPGYFGVVRALRAKGVEPTVVPGLSCVQRAFARLGRPWDDVAVVSTHGRDLRPVLNVCRARSAVAVLTAPGAGPAELATGLRGWSRYLVIAEDLDGPGERLSTLPLSDVVGRAWREPNLVICLREPERSRGRPWLLGGEPTPPPGGWALAESDFDHRNGMITKFEVRAHVLSRLAPRPGTLVWDVGAGCGSVAVECARLGAAVLAVESDPAQCVRISANALRHQVDIRVVEGRAPAVLTDLPEPDAVFVGGGGLDVITTAAEVGASRLVVTLAALDRLPPTREALRAAGYTVEINQLSAARFAEGSRALVNPVLVLSATRP